MKIIKDNLTEKDVVIGLIGAFLMGTSACYVIRKTINCIKSDIQDKKAQKALDE